MRPHTFGGMLRHVWICPDCRSIFESSTETCDRDGAPVAEVRAHQKKAVYPLLGKVCGDRYHLIGGLGKGGLGTVYLAQHRHLGQLFAVKFLDLQGMSMEIDKDQRAGYRRDFLREAQVASLIRHEGVVRVTDFGEHEAMPFLVMEYVPGPSLLQVLASRGRFTTPEAIAIARRIAEALDAFHERRLVHRDLKPANVILDPRGDGRLTLVDLGLVKDLSGPGGRASTHPLALRGTPGYLAPEQVPSWVLSQAGVRAAGEKQLVDERADLYALGVIFYEMLAGACPYPDGSNTQIIVYACTRDGLPITAVEPPVKLMPGLSELVHDTMARDPERRPATAAAFLERLDDVAMSHAMQGSWPSLVVPGRGSINTAAGRASAPVADSAALLEAPKPATGPAPAPAAPAGDPLDDSLMATKIFSDPSPGHHGRSRRGEPSELDGSTVVGDLVVPADQTVEADVDDSLDEAEPTVIASVDETAAPSVDALGDASIDVEFDGGAVEVIAGLSSRGDTEIPAPMRARRDRRRWGTPALAVLLLGGVAAWYFTRGTEAPVDRRPPVRVTRTISAHRAGLADAAASKSRDLGARAVALPRDAGRKDASRKSAGRKDAAPVAKRPPPKRHHRPHRAAHRAATPNQILQQANKAYRAKNFKGALSGYERFLKTATAAHPQYAVVQTRVVALRRKVSEQ